MPRTGTSSTMPLAAGFPARTHQDWQALAAAVVNRTRADDAALTPAEAEAALRTTLPGGLVVDPLYARPDRAEPLGVPGAMPFTRGRALRDPDGSWDVRQLHDDPDADATRAAVLDDLEHGVTSVWLQVGADGLAAGDLATALADVHIDLAPVVVSSVDDQPAAAAALLTSLRGTPGATGNLGLDPLGAAARTGARPELSGLAGLVGAARDLDGVRAVTVDTRVYRDAGAGAPDEIAFAVATGVAYLRRLEEDGVSPREAFGQIEFRVSATADQFLTTAALRALRRVWARVGEVCAVPPGDRGARTHAVTALRMFTRDDPWVNVLRSTLAVFGAAAGGADAITVLPYDTVAGLPEKFSRRLARNTQILLADESHIARVTDPAGGSWYVESLTDQLARGAWTAFQQLEAAGGMASALRDGAIASRIDAARAEDVALLATRGRALTGVSAFPLTSETPLDRRRRRDVATSAGALAPQRDSEAFEKLRDRAAAVAAARGSAPTVVIVALGSPREHGAREMFVTNLLAAGGIRASTQEGVDGATAGLAERVVVLAGSPKGYAADGAAAVTAVRDAGAGSVLIAGRARELDGAEVDGEIYDGMDVVAFLDGLLDRFAASAEGASA